MHGDDSNWLLLNILEVNKEDNNWLHLNISKSGGLSQHSMCIRYLNGRNH